LEGCKDFFQLKKSLRELEHLMQKLMRWRNMKKQFGFSEVTSHGLLIVTAVHHSFTRKATVWERRDTIQCIEDENGRVYQEEDDIDKFFFRIFKLYFHLLDAVVLIHFLIP